MNEKSRDRERGHAEQALLAAELEGGKMAKAKEDAVQPAGSMRTYRWKRHHALTTPVPPILSYCLASIMMTVVNKVRAVTARRRAAADPSPHSLSYPATRSP